MSPVLRACGRAAFLGSLSLGEARDSFRHMGGEWSGHPSPGREPWMPAGTLQHALSPTPAPAAGASGWPTSLRPERGRKHPTMATEQEQEVSPVAGATAIWRLLPKFVAQVT